MPATGLEAKVAATTGVMIIETVKAAGPIIHHYFSATQRVVGFPGAVLTKADFNIEAILGILESEAGQKIPLAEREELIDRWKELIEDREVLGPCTSMHDSWSSKSHIKDLYRQSKTIKFQAKISSQNARANGALNADITDARQVIDSSGRSAVVDVFLHVLNESPKKHCQVHNPVACSDRLSLTVSEVSKQYEDPDTPSDDDSDIDSDYQSVSSQVESDRDSVSTGTG